MKFSELFLAVMACFGAVRSWNCAGGRPYLTLLPRFNFCDFDVKIFYAGPTEAKCTGLAADVLSVGTVTVTAFPRVYFAEADPDKFYTVVLAEKGPTQASYEKVWARSDIAGSELAGSDGTTVITTGTELSGSGYVTPAPAATTTYQLLIFEQVGDAQLDLVYVPTANTLFNVAIFIDNNCNGVHVFEQLSAIREFQLGP